MNSESPQELSGILAEVGGGRESAGERLLPLVYDELRRLAQQRLRRLAPGQTLQATALVHEVWLKLSAGQEPNWNHRGHFFGAAAQAMREILIDNERRRRSLKRGGDRRRLDISQELSSVAGTDSVDLLALDAALEQLEEQWPRHHRVVMLRHFAGFTVAETAEALEVSPATIDRDWAFVRAWLHRQLEGGSPS